MCGILGTVNIKLHKKDLDLLKHRGPDDWGIELIEIDENKIYFGHRRLSILDLSFAGHQPMYSYDEKFLVIFNGEIYNHLELREKLKEVPFKGHSDTETIVNYLAKFGPKSFIDFNGIFAFGLLDIENKKIYIARDRFGVKPIYYWHDGNKFIFSSEIKPILKLTNKFEIDKDALVTFLTLRYNPAPKTLIREVHKLRPGDLLEFDIITGKLSKVLNINEQRIPQIKIDRNKGEDYWTDLLAETLEEAVRRQLLSDVEVGVFLSGGLDSALIAAIASKYVRGKLKTFCIGFEGAESPMEDEREDAKKTAKIVGTDHYEKVVKPEDYLEFVRKSIYFLEEPNGTAPTFAQYEVAKLARKYVKVALAGQGADEIFMGYKRYNFANKLESFLSFRKLILLSSVLLNWHHQLRRLLYALEGEDLYKVFVNAYSVFTRKELEKLLNYQLKQNIDDLKFFYNLINKNDNKLVEIMSILDTYTWLPDELLMYGDKMTMALSLEMRVPFLDNEVVKVVESIPADFKIRNGENKYILKRVAAKYLPKDIIYRKKRGFSLPILKWLKTDLQEHLRRLFVENSHPIHNFVKKEYIERLLDNYQSGKEKDHRKGIVLIHFGIFLETFEKLIVQEGRKL
ncbi:asparagine synthase (glutamine-hydrolyzing) [Phorcysia thermohydrogeniphila]|uniref:asparagine synthase (glutamine-hydrolyzing) n=1 Tax=Phorcysia thermohydrogeniphila TaxID=936138 RepID=A0A4R1G8M9_9BACT|nr:asparagine synthase (glutamine-hydrolyzing) [Phorcysia thermohydrogeniphila]TCK04457.1 asparagine synthase (glutamine-hydrolysing) [Phorcysia thermohydrogeniphila]